MSSLKEGLRGDYADHWSHIKNLKYLIHAAENYIVFVDDDGDVDWETSVAYDEHGHKNASKHHAVMNTYALLETTPCEGLKSDVRIQFKRLIGEAITCSFEHDYVSAEQMLASAKRYIIARSEETSRLWYLSASFVVALPFMVVGALIWMGRDWIASVFGVDFFWIVMCAVAGAMGALLSVITRTGKLKFDCSSGRRLHYLEGGSRICAGVLSGIIVALAIRSEMFLAPLARGDRMHGAMIVVAFAAGAVERLATSIISTVGVGHAKFASRNEGPGEDRDDS